MKKSKFTTLLLLAKLSFVFGQGGGPTNNFIFGNFLGWNGSNGTNPLFVRTNNIDRITVSQLGFGMPLVPFSLPPLII
jgi:hypothetical protein